MSKLDALKQLSSKSELAQLIGVKPSFLTYTLYVIRPENQYTTFTIPKKNGGTRTICSPTNNLKSLQSGLSTLLLDCIDEINELKRKNSKNYKSTLSHGFVRKRSILTNATMHLSKKNVLNIDLQDFFESFHFGRVRGFFIKNNNFKLHPHIATVIAQIACYESKLPQGSPCSPVITNLISHSLDIKLASFARRFSCVYSRYADDITISTCKSIFPEPIMRQEDNAIVLGKKFRNEINRAGFLINKNKTRIQYKNSRQDVTGLIVNKKPNVRKEYWRTVKSQCNSLFHTGAFIQKTVYGQINGNLKKLEGKLNFIDQVDYYNRLRQKKRLDPDYQLAKHGYKTLPLCSSREKTFRKFLFYKLFYGNSKPTILCEGKTDNIYLKSAISNLVNNYPKLAKAKSKNNDYQLLIHFIKYSRRTRFLLGLDGGTSCLNNFIDEFDDHYKFYKAQKPQNPVIIVLDNDSGFKKIAYPLINKKSFLLYPANLQKDVCVIDDLKEAYFIHITHNLYIVLTPLSSTGENTDIEYLFDDVTRLMQYKERCFNTVANRNNKDDLSKESFAKNIVKAQKNTINFNRFVPLLNRIVSVIDHYNSIK